MFIAGHPDGNTRAFSNANGNLQSGNVGILNAANLRLESHATFQDDFPKFHATSQDEIPIAPRRTTSLRSYPQKIVATRNGRQQTSNVAPTSTPTTTTTMIEKANFSAPPRSLEEFNVQRQDFDRPQNGGFGARTGFGFPDAKNLDPGFEILSSDAMETTSCDSAIGVSPTTFRKHEYESIRNRQQQPVQERTPRGVLLKRSVFHSSRTSSYGFGFLPSINFKAVSSFVLITDYFNRWQDKKKFFKFFRRTILLLASTR